MHDKSSTPLRIRLLVDPDVQGAILIRAAWYGSAGILYMSCVLYFSMAMGNPDKSMSEHLLDFAVDAIYWLPGLLLLAPIIAHDILRMSNRFAGPIYRLRISMEKLAAGEESDPIHFRDGDNWLALAEHYNQLREELMERRANDAKTPARPAPPPRFAESADF
ncbi:hypothetical protein FF011L_50950 [Roseimaritima multifibrata]|uniref:HAMP domain-containing protein n=1 Tax=Roseimaritima multifibrata TaxID=1930274 RepID=A0A517MNC7_9BACT|nr:hypothetical protein [Roseimaritima multifibrata]QDS96287.1 hypothetical protein FF011L_50950 [Roseimaritima multifibrata]